MPKLDATHTTQRLSLRLAQLTAGEDVPSKDIRALLSSDQLSELEAEWLAQQELRLFGRARKAEWKTKRQVQIEVLERAIKRSKAADEGAWQKKLTKSNARQLRIYMEALKAARAEGLSKEAARTWANNELTRAGLARLDGQGTLHHSKREREVKEMEDWIIKSLETDHPVV